MDECIKSNPHKGYSKCYHAKLAANNHVFTPSKQLMRIGISPEVLFGFLAITKS